MKKGRTRGREDKMEDGKGESGVYLQYGKEKGHCCCRLMVLRIRIYIHAGGV